MDKKLVEAEIRQKLESWKQAFVEKNIDGLTENYVPDAVMFDVKETLIGVGAIRILWEVCLPLITISPASRHEDLTFHISDDTVIVSGYFLMLPAEQGPELRPRITLCFKKHEGAWKIFHEHFSLPYNFDTSQIELEK